MIFSWDDWNLEHIGKHGVSRPTFDGRDYQGIAPGAQVIPLKVDPDGQATSGVRIEKALEWVEDALGDHPEIAAVNMSFNLGNRKIGQAYVLSTDTNGKNVVQRLHESGVFLAAAAGNGNIGFVNYPAVDYYVYAVAAVDADDRMPERTHWGSDVNLLAPGVRLPILDAGTGYARSNDPASSYATPYVTGAALRIKDYHSGFTPAQIMQILQDSGAPVTTRHMDNGTDQATDHTYRRLDLLEEMELAEKRKRSAGSSGPYIRDLVDPRVRTTAGKVDEITIELSEPVNSLTELRNSLTLQRNERSIGLGSASLQLVSGSTYKLSGL